MSVREEMQGRVLVVTIDRPAARNALDGATMAQLRERFEALAYLEPLPAAGGRAGCEPGDYRPHAVLLRSEGDVFCAGADLGDMKRLGSAGFDENLTAATAMGGMFRAIRNCPAPVVARVQGPAYGGGVGLAGSCDVVVASAEARFAFTEVRLGLVPGVIAPIVIERMGPAATRCAFLTAEPLRAVDAFRLGLIDRLAGAEGLDAAVAQVLVALLKGGPAALGRAKGLVDGAAALGFSRSAEFAAKMITDARTSDEAQAALQAFLAKKPVPWVAEAVWPPEGTDE